MIKYSTLSCKPGDEIRIVAPASAPEKNYIDTTINSLERKGYVVSVGKNIYNRYHQFSAEDKLRLSDFQTALDDPAVKAVFCARGGYGSVRIVDMLNLISISKTPKWIVGFSDVTVFHSMVHSLLQLPTIHAPMPVNTNSGFFETNLQTLCDLMMGVKSPIFIETHPLNKPGHSKGVLVGGNLSILYSLQSTKYQLETSDKILFIEDVGEQLYHLDRMMQNLKLSGYLKRLKGLIVGGMTEMQDKRRPFGKTAYEIISETVDSYDYPVMYGFPAGHMKNNHPFILGEEMTMEVTDKGSKLTYVYGQA